MPAVACALAFSNYNVHWPQGLAALAFRRPPSTTENSQLRYRHIRRAHITTSLCLCLCLCLCLSPPPQSALHTPHSIPRPSSPPHHQISTSCVAHSIPRPRYTSINPLSLRAAHPPSSALNRYPLDGTAERATLIFDDHART
jgi:hypothetical protein